MSKTAKIKTLIDEDLSKLLFKLKDVPDFKYLRGISSAYDEGVQKYQNMGLINEKETVDNTLVSLVILKEVIKRIESGTKLGIYDNEMLNSYFVSDDETGSELTFSDGTY